MVGLEVGAGQAGAVARLLAAAGFAAVDTRPDLAGIERICAVHSAVLSSRPIT